MYIIAVMDIYIYIYIYCVGTGRLTTDCNHVGLYISYIYTVAA